MRSATSAGSPTTVPGPRTPGSAPRQQAARHLERGPAGEFVDVVHLDEPDSDSLAGVGRDGYPETPTGIAVAAYPPFHSA